MKKIITTVLILSVASWMLAGCQTQSTLSTGPNRGLPDTGPNLKEAAEKRRTLGLKYLELGNYQRAKINLEKALRYEPDSAENQAAMGYYFQVVREFDKAEQHFREALSLAPNDGGILNLYGTFLCAAERYAAAERYFLKAIEAPGYANIAQTYENAGVCALRAGNKEVAEEYFEKALNHNPESPTALLGLAKFRFEQNRLIEARSLLKEHLKVAPVSAEALWLGVQIEERLGDKDAMASYALKLTGLFPNSPEAKAYRQWRQK
ncbi:MAG: type IV pilus biogenesis/stability protein PilW [Gammaproteobacteria bacterium]|nr:MAG: type IV pilus biogenesis/stability protein PilW [Gammaproteobacteria bacterium]